MATRFKKMRTRKMRKTKALKTRKHRGGAFSFFGRPKSPLTSNTPVKINKNSFVMGTGESERNFLQRKLQEKRPRIESAENMRNYLRSLGLGESPLNDETLLAKKNNLLKQAEKIVVIRKGMNI